MVILLAFNPNTWDEEVGRSLEGRLRLAQFTQGVEGSQDRIDKKETMFVSAKN